MSADAKIIDEYLQALPDWQKYNLEIFRRLIHLAEPAVTEDWKWSVPVFVLGNSMIFAMSAFKAHTKYNFILNGALLKDENTLFNNGLESLKSRSIDVKEGESIDQTKLRALIEESLSLACQV